jgi:hypothetical protein
MRLIASQLSVFVTGTVLLAVMVLLGTSRLEYCGQPEVLRPWIGAAVAAEGPSPTLAPPQKVVFVRVEADKADLEISWAEN